MTVIINWPQKVVCDLIDPLPYEYDDKSRMMSVHKVERVYIGKSFTRLVYDYGKKIDLDNRLFDSITVDEHYIYIC